MKKINQTVAIATLGCKVNQCESVSVENSFEDNGIQPISFSSPADIYVINTCAVTAKAAAQSRQMIRKAMRTNPKARIVVTGCYAQVEAEKIREITENKAIVIGNQMKDQLVAISMAETDPVDLTMDEIGKATEVCQLPIKRFGNRTRPFLKIQDGCNNFCTYCIVPFARGRSRSLAPAKVLQQAILYGEAGYQEVVLTGIHVGDYGHDLKPRQDLASIIKKLTGKTPAIRYRISSLEPTEISPALIDLLTDNKNLAPHLHIPLQSGDDTILKKMNRRYRSKDFNTMVTDLLKRLPYLAIGVDVLVGFPGEDDAAFNNTLNLLAYLPIAYLHVFPYSQRPGTVAAKMGGQIPKKIKAQRVARLRELDRRKRLDFYHHNLGRECWVLAEGSTKTGRFLRGFSENYIPVKFTGPRERVHRLSRVRLERIIDEREVLGTLLD